MKNNKNILMLLSFCSLVFVSCDQAAPFTRTLYSEDFSSGKVYTTFADLPASPTSEEDLQIYKELGFNTCLLTEDSVSMVDSDGNLTDDYKNAIRNIGNAGMKCWIRNMYNDPDYFVCSEVEATKTRSNYGTPYSLTERNITNEFDEFDDIITGFYMFDEAYQNTSNPFEHKELPEGTDYVYSAFDQMEKLVNWYNTYYSDKTFHTNQVPSSSINHWTKGKTYKSFIENYVSTIVDNLEGSGSKTLCLDNYPFVTGNPDVISDTFLTDMLTVALVNRDHNVGKEEDEKTNFGFCVQLHGYTSTTDASNSTIPPESTADVSYILYTGMSMGAETIEYFAYRSLSGVVEGIISAEGEKTDAYYYTKEANEKALPLQDVLLDFEWKNYAVVEADDEDLVENKFAFDNVKTMTDDSDFGVLNVSATETRLDCSIGHFQKGSQDGYMVVNQSSPKLNETNTTFLNFKGCDQALIYHEDSVEFVKLNNGRLRVNMGPGDAYFIIPGTSK